MEGVAGEAGPHNALAVSLGEGKLCGDLNPLEPMGLVNDVEDIGEGKARTCQGGEEGS